MSNKLRQELDLMYWMCLSTQVSAKTLSVKSLMHEDKCYKRINMQQNKCSNELYKCTTCKTTLYMDESFTSVQMDITSVLHAKDYICLWMDHIRPRVYYRLCISIT
jgi:hypothetical protein